MRSGALWSLHTLCEVVSEGGKSSEICGGQDFVSLRCERGGEANRAAEILKMVRKNTKYRKFENFEFAVVCVLGWFGSVFGVQRECFLVF